MTKIFVYAAKPELANKAVEQLRVAGADRAELLEHLNIPARQPKENRYLLICETPAEKLTALAPKVLPEADYAQELGCWYEAQSHIVTTATAQKKRSIVATSGQLADAKNLLTSINDQWGLSLKVQEAKAPSVKSEEQLLAYLVQNLIEQTGPLQALQHQINSLAGIDDEALHEVDALTGYRGLVQRQAEQQSQNHQLASKQAELNNQLKDLTEENELLLAQLHTVQVELERIFLESNKFKEDAAKEKADLTAARDAQSKAAADRQKQLDAIKAQEESTRVENEALLNHLHQVQEELEHYFIKYKASDLQLSKLKARWQKVLESQPHYFDYDAIEVNPKSPGADILHWRIQGLASANVNRDLVEFESFIEAGVLGIRFHNKNDPAKATLSQWPKVAESQSQIEFIPVGQREVKTQRAKILRNLSGSDWELLRLLSKVIGQAVKKQLVTLGSDYDFIAALNKLKNALDHLPNVLRYDFVTLKQNQVNPDYEHLWFEFNNMSFGNNFWPKFEIRLGAANIEPHGFTVHPKIEIPLINGTAKPFGSWFPETKDDFGEKLEIRFDLKMNLIDQRVWQLLSDEDQKLVIASVQNLVKTSENRFQNKDNLCRDWSEWKSVFSRCELLLNNQ